MTDISRAETRLRLLELYSARAAVASLNNLDKLIASVRILEAFVFEGSDAPAKQKAKTASKKSPPSSAS